MECLKQRVVDPSLLQLIGRFLKFGTMEEGKYFDTEMGTPQGGILSPVLANVYPHYALDKWFEDVVKQQLPRYRHRLFDRWMTMPFASRKKLKPEHLGKG
ncbi:MAG: hypothetical protein C4B59_17260 [Candidatus Methanogaster sp.]|uniref:Uncharacterized protein n=1 Tax=Candidatus Methanogaster sp. TaxID=3386292 RepID=A0AC61KXT5_9EURY|nr:MAG: hypothetical protein C4B59_17260 [ANME-2 cluster archaeon]